MPPAGQPPHPKQLPTTLSLCISPPTPSSLPRPLLLLFRCRSGDCRLGVNEGSCSPRLQHWKNAALTHQALEGGQPLDLTGMECVQPKHDIDINTTTAGASRLASVTTPVCHMCGACGGIGWCRHTAGPSAAASSHNYIH